MAHANFPAAVEVYFPVRTYSQVIDSIRQIDFKNRKFRLLGEEVRLRNGLYNYDGLLKGTDAFHRYEVRLEKVIYFHNEGSEPQMVLLAFNRFEAVGSSNDEGIILIFGMNDKHLRLLQELIYDRQAPGTGDFFNSRSEILTITTRASDGSARCCPKYLETARFKWNGTKFELTSRKISDVIEKSD